MCSYYIFVKRRDFWFYCIGCSRRTSFNPVVFGEELANTYCMFVDGLLINKNNEIFQLLGDVAPPTSPRSTHYCPLH